jgi:polysaccharide deacetylase 2 family uncharacterized protein YibQ
MPPTRRRIRRKKKKHHVILILLLIIVVTFLFFEEFGRENIPKRFFDIFKPEISLPEIPSPGTLPKVAIVMDDLGPNKKKAMDVLNIKSPLTLSILPQQTYSSWIAEQGKRRGHDIIIHLPMEATRPLKLGAGGLYTWMADKEISQTIEEDIHSVPYIKGASNHMGSAFTKDERAMRAVMSELKKHGLFFLDSLTTPESVGFKLAKGQGLKALRRDIFLDNSSNPVEIETQWKKFMTTAQKKGYAIALAHPKKNTLEFLQKVLRDNKEVTVVPISELIID